MNTFDRIWTALAVVLMILPFAALGYELVKSESSLTIAVFAAMGALLFGTLIMGMRVRPEAPHDQPETETESTTAHSPVETHHRSS